jgi:hypothetical protein
VTEAEKLQAYRALNDHYLARAVLQLSDENRNLQFALRVMDERLAALELEARKRKAPAE